MEDGALLTISPDTVRSAVGPEPSRNPNRTSIVRHFVDALNNDDRDQTPAGTASGGKRDRAARRRVSRRVRRPKPITVTVSDLVRGQQ